MSMTIQRPAPASDERLLAGVGSRGRYNIFLRRAGGAGTPCLWPRAGQAEAAPGRDGVLGSLAPHGRAETIAQAQGLETVPRRQIEYRATTIPEMGLAAILRRSPELCLIDELAHT